MLNANWKLAILGCGTLGEAILKGLFRAGRVSPAQVTVTARRAEVVEALHRRHEVAATTDNVAAAQAADVVLVALKPQQLATVLGAPDLREALAGKLVISVVRRHRARSRSARSSWVSSTCAATTPSCVKAWV